MEFSFLKRRFLTGYENFKRMTLDRVPLKKLLPKIYLLSVFTGFALTGLYATFLPNLVFCTSIFGDNLCDPAGNYVITFVSFPGYILAGFISVWWSKAPAYIYFLVLFLISLLVYFLIGAFIDKLRTERNKQLKLIYVIIFVALFVLFLLAAVLI